jgi:hypothetical protein
MAAARVMAARSSHIVPSGSISRYQCAVLRRVPDRVPILWSGFGLRMCEHRPIAWPDLRRNRLLMTSLTSPSRPTSHLAWPAWAGHCLSMGCWLWGSVAVISDSHLPPGTIDSRLWLRLKTFQTRDAAWEGDQSLFPGCVCSEGLLTAWRDHAGLAVPRGWRLMPLCGHEPPRPRPPHPENSTPSLSYGCDLKYGDGDRAASGIGGSRPVISGIISFVAVALALYVLQVEATSIFQFSSGRKAVQTAHFHPGRAPSRSNRAFCSSSSEA